MWSKIWKLLNEERSFKAIVFLTGIVGTTIVTVIGGGWAAFTWYYEKFEKTEETARTAETAETAETVEKPSMLDLYSDPYVWGPEIDVEQGGSAPDDTINRLGSDKFIIAPSQLLDDISMKAHAINPVMATLEAGKITKFEGELRIGQEELLLNNFSTWLTLNQYDFKVEVEPAFRDLNSKEHPDYGKPDIKLLLTTGVADITAWYPGNLAFGSGADVAFHRATKYCQDEKTSLPTMGSLEAKVVGGVEYTTENSRGVHSIVLFNCR